MAPDYLLLFLCIPVIIAVLFYGCSFFFKCKTRTRGLIVLIAFLIASIVSLISYSSVASETSQANIASVMKDENIQKLALHGNSGKLDCNNRSKTTITAVSWKTNGVVQANESEQKLGVLIMTQAKDKDGKRYCKVSIKKTTNQLNSIE